MKPHDLLLPKEAGLYCPAGDFYIDPVRPVARALITHGHADHARPGHEKVLATRETLDIMALRMGAGCYGAAQAAAYGERLDIGGVAVSFHPAGHVLGSAQIRLEHRGLSIVVSGDYKRQSDPTTPAFEPQACDVFITEATFGLPVFRHPPPLDEISKVLASLAQNPQQTHLVGAYALGKAQRLMALLRQAGYDAPIHIHGALEKVTRYYQSRGVDLGEIALLQPGGKAATPTGGVVLCPPSALHDRWSQRFGDAARAMASGWMRVRARARQSGVSLPLIISDHVDWPDLTRTIDEVDPGEVWVTHGQEDALIHWLAMRQRAARPLRLVGYGDEEEEAA